MNADRICTIDGCDTAVYARGWCHKHYTRWRIHGDPAADNRRVRKACSIEGCERPSAAHGWCSKHYQRWLKHGDPLYVKPTTCSIEGCERTRLSKQGWCNMHLKRWQRHGDPEYQRPVTCSVPKCGRSVYALGWCKMHHRRWERHGDPATTLIHTGPAEDRLWSNVERGPEDSCWPWAGKIHPKGYGVLSVDGRQTRAHRYTYELSNGLIPAGYSIDHTCHDPSQCSGGNECPHRRCCNPAHLKAVPPGHNNIKERCISRNGEKTHCKRGHAFTPGNTKITTAGGRACRRCIAMLAHERYLKRKQREG